MFYRIFFTVEFTNWSEKKAVRTLQYGLRTRLATGILFVKVWFLRKKLLPQVHEQVEDFHHANPINPTIIKMVTMIPEIKMTIITELITSDGNEKLDGINKFPFILSGFFFVFLCYGFALLY